MNNEHKKLIKNVLVKVIRRCELMQKNGTSDIPYLGQHEKLSKAVVCVTKRKKNTK